jgi:hypothetical protein
VLGMGYEHRFTSIIKVNPNFSKDTLPIKLFKDSLIQIHHTIIWFVVLNAIICIR